MRFSLSFTPVAKEDLRELKTSQHFEKRFKAVSKALKYLQENPRHPSLQTHKFISLFGPDGEEVFEAYAEQDTPAAYRIFFYYGRTRGEIVIIAITPHP
jgi:hypothetical protein